MIKRRTGLYIAAAVAVSFLITLLCVLTGNYAEDSLDVKVGNISQTKIVAPRQIENTYATEKKRQEAAASVTPLIRIDNNVTEIVNSEIKKFFDELEERKTFEDANTNALNGDSPPAENSADESVSIETPNAEITDNDNAANTASESADAQSTDSEIKSATDVFVTDEQFEAYKSQTRSVRIEIRDALTALADSILERGIKDEIDTKSILQIRDELNKKPWPTELRDMGYTIVTEMLMPNLVEDKEATAAATRAKSEEVDPVIILQGQKIIDEGEIITEEIYSLLRAFDMIKDSPDRNIFTPLGAIILIVLIFTVFIMYASLYYKNLINSQKTIVLLTILFCLSMILVRVLAGITFYIIPITIPCILIAILIDERLSIFLYFHIVMLAALIYRGNFEFMVYFTVSGCVAVLMSKFTFQRTKLILVGFLVCIANFALVTAINLFFYKSIDTESMFVVLIAMANGLLSLFIAVGSLPIWESAFDIITPVKLLDLTSPNNPLLRKLTIEAPGTYHHSLIVANLAEQAAHDIDANAPLARVGGYYHDVGKLKYPYYFGENQTGINTHEDLDPYDSAQIIMQHVPSGIELADHHELPKVIKDIIAQHHGTSLVKFFYYKAKQLYSDQQIKEDDFRYKCIIPKTRESAIVMLADTAEAAVRSMVSSSKSMEEVEDFLSVLIKDKLDDAQLDESHLAISDLVTIRKSFMKVFRGMYHERVKYPSATTTSKASKIETKITDTEDLTE